MRASVWKMSVLILAVAVVATGQTMKPMTTRTAPVNAADAVKTDPVTTTRDAQGVWFIAVSYTHLTLPTTPYV